MILNHFVTASFFHAQKYNCFGCDVVYNELISKQKVIEKVKSSERKSDG